MSALTQARLDELRAVIEDELRVIRRSMSLSADSREPVTLDQTSVGRLSRMDAIQSQAMQQGLHERELGRLGALESALTRIDAGTYGTCTTCNTPIPYGRLLVLPEARTCATC